MIQARRKTVWRFLKKLGIKPPCDPETPLLGVYPEETKTERDTFIQFFFAALFTYLEHETNLDVHRQING